MNPSTPSFTRREVLRLSGAALALSALPAQAADEGFEFIAVNDTHYIDAVCGEWHRKVVAAMRESAPKAVLCLHAGDLTDMAERESCQAMKEIYGGLGFPFHVVPGNHDSISNTDRSGYDAVFPGKLNYVVKHGGWQFLGLDTTEGVNFSETKIADSTLQFVDQQLTQLDRKAPTFVFTHFPLGDGTEMRPLNADALIARLQKLNLKWIHSGHWHAESSVPNGAATLTTSRCCARLRGNRDRSPLKGWHVYRAQADGTLSRRFVQVPG